jgi:anthranilate synthase/aminodeoxychorismate synthase-like glutamine amidotransferase
VVAKIVIIDHSDSFTHILADYFAQITGVAPAVINHKDAPPKKLLKKIAALNPTHLVLSPGPGTVTNPHDFAIGFELIKKYQGVIPILGVCLGHQGIGAFYGTKIKKIAPIHGQKSQITHSRRGIFKGIKNPLTAMRYHSLAIDPASFSTATATSSKISVTAEADDGTIMAIEHLHYKVFGVQFHPESIGTEEGKKLLKNFLHFQ